MQPATPEMGSWNAKPLFQYQEIFKDGRSYHGFSSGKGVFYDAETEDVIADPAFAVVKNRTTSSLVVAAYSPRLRSFLASAFSNTISSNFTDSFCYDFKNFLSNYTALQGLFRQGQWDNMDDVRLFMQDFLLDINLWSSFGFENLYELGILSASHWQDMQNWSMERDIDDLEELIDTNEGDDDEEGESTSVFEVAVTNVQDVDKRLWLAAKEGRADEVRWHLMQRDLLVGANCLTIALQRGHIDIFWLLFNFGAAVGADPERWMAEPIFAAAKLGCLEAVQSLMHQANIQNRTSLSKLCYRPLRGAVEGGHEVIVSYFVSLGADLKSGGYHDGVMVRAARHGRLQMMQWLQSRGVPLDPRTLVVAAERGHHRVVKYILDADVIKKRSYHARGALIWSIKRNDLPLFNLLLEYGVDAIDQVRLNHYYYLSPCPMETAISFNRVDMLRQLGQNCGSLSSSRKQGLMGKAERNPTRFVEMIQIVEKIPLLVEAPEPSLSRSSTSYDNPFERTSRFDTPYLYWNEPYTSALETPSTYCTHRRSVLGGYLNYFSLSTRHQQSNQGLRATLKKQMSNSRDLNHCPILAKIKARAKLAMRTRLRENFLRMHAEFLEKASSLDASCELSMFAEHIGTAQRVWEKGFDSIRRLLNNQIPSSLQEVFACVQLSSSMQFLLEESGKSENTHETFLSDLDRWRLVIPDNDQGIYDEITRVIWGKSDQIIPVNTDWLREQDNLEYFQKLMTSLISESRSSWVVPDSAAQFGGQRLSAIHEQFDARFEASFEYDVSCPSSEGPSLPPKTPKNNSHEGILGKWKPASPMVMLLTATTIFVVFVTFLLVLRLHETELTSSLFMENLKIQRSLRHHCYILALYLGVSAQPNSPEMELDTQISPSNIHSQHSPNSQAGTISHDDMEYDSRILYQLGSSVDTSSSALQQTPPFSEFSPSGGPARKQCSECLKTFSTISNLNRHKKTDCKFGKMARYNCRNRGCRQEFTREAYRAMHEKEKCSVRRRAQTGARAIRYE